MKTKNFSSFSESFEKSADTLNYCKQQLLKGVQRLNNAGEVIEKCNAETEQINALFLAELRKQKEKEAKIDQIKAQKEAVKANIIALQTKIKEKKEKA